MTDTGELVHFQRSSGVYKTQETGYAHGYLDAILENSSDGIYVTDGEANTLFANKSYEIISGLDRDSVIGKNMRDLVEGGVISISGSLHALESGQPFTSEQVFSTGKRAYIISTPVFNEEGKIVLVVTNVKDITELHAVRRELRKKEALNKKYHEEIATLRHEFDIGAEIVTVDSNMLGVVRVANRVAMVDATVTIQGEPGTGKETLARYIHARSPRLDRPFIRISISSIPAQMLEVALFGYGDPGKQGYRRGLLESADGGTAYIDEVFALSLEVQNRLLMLIKNGMLMPVDGTPRKADIRIIAGTRYSISKMENRPGTNKDLYYELSTFAVRIPSLCDRKDDIIPLLDNFLAEFNARYHKNKVFDSLVYARLLIYPGPGNVRELQNLVQRALILSESEVISVSDFFVETPGDFPGVKGRMLPDKVDLKTEVEKLEAEYMTMAFDKHGNTRGAAKNLGMDSSTFVRKRQNYIAKGLMQKHSKTD